MICPGCLPSHCSVHEHCLNINHQLIHMQHLQTEKPVLSFDDWKVELVRISARETGTPEVTMIALINFDEAKKWWQDGWSPYATFRETYSNENDSE